MPKAQTVQSFIQKSTMALAVLLVAVALGREAMVLMNSNYDPGTSDVTDASDVLPPVNIPTPHLALPKN